MRAEFERVGGSAVLNNSPYDLAAATLVLEEAGAVVTDLKLAIREAANDFVEDSPPHVEEEQLNFEFRLLDDRLLLELNGRAGTQPSVEQELGRAIIDATVDECRFD